MTPNADFGGYSTACSRCGAVFPWEVAEVFFRRTRSLVARVRATRRPVCIGCEQTKRDRNKRKRRALRKAHDTIADHAKKHGMSKRDFAIKYGWDAERIAHDIEHAYDNTCCYCWQAYADMGHGLADVTIDVIDAEDEPYYTTNTRPCCHSCNTEKGRLTKAQWARKLIGWNIWRERQRLIEQGIAPTQLELIDRTIACFVDCPELVIAVSSNDRTEP